MKSLSARLHSLPGVAVLLLVALVGATACGRRGSGTPARDVRSVPSFTRAAIAAHATLSLHVDPAVTTPFVQISGDDDVVPLLHTTVDDDTLHIEFDSEPRPNLPLEISITVANLSALRISGAVDGRVTGLHTDDFQLHVSGAAKLALQGEAAAATMRVSGAVHLNASQLIATKVKLRVSGAAQASVHATSRLDVKVSGAAGVRYSGNPPTIRKTLSGAASVTPK